MSITSYKITDSDISSKGVVAAPTVLSGSPEENKKVFDRLVREVLKGDFNALVDALAATTGAGEIGAAVEGLTGETVQAVLIALKTMLDSKAASADMEAALGGKSDTSVTDAHFKSVAFDAGTGVFTFTKENGTTVTVDTALEKVAVNFAYDEDTQSLVLTLADGSTQHVSLAAFLTTTEFEDSNTIEWSVSGSKVRATIKSGSITDAMLSSTLKTMLQGYVSAAATSATNAAASEANAATSATNAANNAARSLGYQNAARAAAKEAEASQQEAKADADRAASASAHQPQISSDGYWELWDLTQGVYVKTAYQAQGPAGENGDSYTVKGLYATLAALQAAHPTGSAGDAWFVGTAEDNVVYQWDVDQAKWVNVGALKGPQGTAAGFGAPTATVDDNTGTPSVEVTASGPDTAKVFTFTFKNLKGEKGADGKSAYASAQDGGYTGTETEFAEKLAQEQLAGTTDDLTPSQVYDAVSAGIPVKVQYTDSTYGLLSFTAFNVAESLSVIVSQAIVYYNGVYILAELFGNKSKNVWGFKATTLAQKTDIPSALPNPNALTLKIGSTTATYDGSSAQTVEITGSDGTPDYVLTAADALAKKVVNHIGADNIVFAVMADAHLGVYTDTANAAGKQAGQALKRLNERCTLDFVAHCGDYTTGAWNTDVEATLQDNADYQLLIGSQYPGKAVWVVGNHDDAPYQATASRMTQTQVYAAISRKNLASGGVVPNNACYGYTDFPGMRLRVIYLDTHDRRSWGSAQVGAGATCDYLNVENIGAVQLQWLADHALDFSGVDDPSKWSILIFSHAVLGTSGTYTDPGGTVHPCNTANAATLLKAYATKKSGSITHGGVAVNYNFTAVTPAGIIGCIHGHEHRYANEIVGGAFLSICCPNVLNGRERVSADGNTYTKTAGTANGTSFCVFSINRDDKKIYVDHYGPGIDRVFNYTVIDPSAPSYTNLLPSATDTDGSVYNDVGYAVGQRLNSSGTVEDYAGIYLTGFIPVSFGDVVRLKNVTWQYGVTSGITSNNQRVCFYDSSKTYIGLANGTSLAGTLAGVKDDNNIWTQFTVKNAADLSLNNAAYFRLCCAGITGESIITVNEEIT